MLKQAYAVVSIVPNERNAVWHALQTAGYKAATPGKPICRTNGEVLTWTLKGSPTVLEVCIGAATNVASATALAEMEAVARSRGLFINRAVVYACAGGLYDPNHPGALMAQEPDEDAVQAWLEDENVYRIYNVIYGAWGAVEHHSSGWMVRESVRVHDPVFGCQPPPPSPGHPETRRKFLPHPRHPWEEGLIQTRAASALATEKVYKAHPLSWQFSHRSGAAPQAKVTSAQGYASRVDYVDVSQLVQRLVHAAATAAAPGRLAPSPSPAEVETSEMSPLGGPPADTSLVVEMESLGLWNTLGPDAVVLRVVTDVAYGKDKVAIDDPHLDWHLNGYAPSPTDAADRTQAAILQARSGILESLFTGRPEVVSIESLASSMWRGSGLTNRRFVALVTMLSGLEVTAVTEEGKGLIAQANEIQYEAKALDVDNTAFERFDQILGDRFTDQRGSRDPDEGDWATDIRDVHWGWRLLGDYRQLNPAQVRRLRSTLVLTLLTAEVLRGSHLSRKDFDKWLKRAASSVRGYPGWDPR